VIALAWLAARWRLVVAGVVVAGLLGWWGYTQHLRRAATQARQQATVATQTAQVAQATTGAVSRAQDRIVVVHEKSEVAADAVRNAPGADAPLPPAVLDAWRSGIDGLRHDAAGGGAPEHP